MTLPALIPKSVIIVAVAAEIDMEPIFNKDRELLIETKASADVVENAVQDYLYAVFVKLFADLCKVFICAKAAVYLAVISGIIAVSVGIEHR